MPVVRETNENKIAHAMATHHRLATRHWRHKVGIKDLFVDDVSHDAIDALCRRAVAELTAVIESEKRRRDHVSEDERDYFLSQLDNVRDGFDGLIGAASDSIQVREDSFNYQLAELYDIGDAKIELRDGSLQKFLWVN